MPGRAALDPGESRPPSRRSGCVSAEPYPPLGCNQYSGLGNINPRECLHKILDTAVSPGSPTPLEISQKARDSHFSTAPTTPSGLSKENAKTKAVA
jgi:hypothetical protein